MINKIKNTLLKYNMIAGNDKIIIAFSGGGDSCALLHTMCKLQNDYKIEIAAVHVNHGVRGDEAARDEAFAGKFCESLGVPYKAYHVDVPSYAADNRVSIEEAARLLRYKTLNKALLDLSAAKIAVAHNLNDRAETVLMRLMRGSSGYGLRGMEPVKGNIIRPLYECSRMEIEAYLDTNHIEYMVDSTNMCLDYTRNNVRHKLLPLIEAEFNPNIINTLARTSVLLGEDAQYLNKLAEEAFAKHVRIFDQCCIIEGEAFINVHKAIISRLIRLCIKSLRGSDKDFSAVHTQLAYDAYRLTSGKRFSLSKDIYVSNCFGNVAIYIVNNDKIKDRELKNNDFVYVDEQVGFLSVSYFRPVKKENFINTFTEVFKYDKIGEALLLRARKKGDKFSINPDRTAKLKDFLIARKVPVFLRDNLYLLAAQDQVLWIFGAINETNIACRAQNEEKKIYIQLWRQIGE